MNGYKSHKTSTSNFCLAATLPTIRCQLIKTDDSNTRRIVFIFATKEKFSSLSDKYWSNQIKATLQKFYSSQRQLTTIMYQKNDHVN